MLYFEYKYLIFSDLYRITKSIKKLDLIKHILFGESYKYIFWMRTCKYTKKHPLFKIIFFPLARLMLSRYMYKFGIGIPYNTNIDSGFFIGHFCEIFVNSNAIIGKNCNLSQGVTIGKSNRGSKMGTPVIGDNVYIGPGAKIVGSLTIGNNVAIGANCVVTKDIPDNSVVVGVPGRVISTEGSVGYINRIDYDNLIKR